MTSVLHVSSRPAQWTLEQPAFAEGEVTVNSFDYNSDAKPSFPICEYKTSERNLPEIKPTCEFKTTEFTSSGFTSVEFQQVSEAAEKPALTIVEDNTSPEGEMARSIVKIEARFENKLTGHCIWKVGTGLLFSPDVVVTGSEIVYDAEYQLGTATQIKCYIGNRGRNVSETQPRYGQSVRFSAEWTEGHNRRSRDIAFIKVASPSVVSSSQQTVSEEKPTVPAVTHCCNCSGHVEPIPTVVAEPVVEPVIEPVVEAEPEPEVIQPEIPVAVCVEPILEPELEIPAPASQSDCGFVEIEAEAPIAQADDTPDTSVVEEADITDPFYEALKSVSQLDNKTFDIESSLIDDVGQFASVATGALVSYVVGAEIISSGAATELPGVPERALLAEASLQAVLAIKQSDELDEIIASMKTNWTANAPQIDQLSELLAPYLSEAAKYIVENHQQSYTAQVAVKPLQRRSLGIRDFNSNASIQAFVKGLFEPSLPLAGREEIFTSLGPVLRTAVSNAQQIVDQAGKMTIGSQVPRLLQKYDGATASVEDVQATRVLVHRSIIADVAYQTLSTLSDEKLRVLEVIPVDNGSPQDETVFDFVKRIMQEEGAICLQYANEAVHKFIPLLIDRVAQVLEPAPVKIASSKFALRDFLNSKKGSVKTL
ncbi:uncharacterized protein B0J16DRAFT_320816 [Fusarium flagelliforme]|uniref:uncharacterized protein n=1 Tax=Fusarium flagelliforme TaxID=2675880 RepID=UPI001E8E4BDF|nr:uncharacterized protein B0J16DRAFT_320816 [Fusarium flagelliforme]KAH7186057.1 hypothetical protein B0J16DRAFT_320816 [Fusarium flagelliforme]